MLYRVLILLLAVSACSYAQRLQALPSTLNFTYQQGLAAPAPQTLQITRLDAGNPLGFRIIEVPEWIIATPLNGVSGDSITVRVNPGALAPGVYTGRLSAGGIGVVQAATVTITMTITAPAPAATLDNANLDFNWKTDMTELPAPKRVLLMTNGEKVDFTVASGVPWIQATPVSGTVSLRSPTSLYIFVDPTATAPGKPLKGVVTVNLPSTVTKMLQINVNLDVQAGAATISSAWPSAIPLGSSDTTVVVRGGQFYAGLTTVSLTNGSSRSNLTPQIVDGTRLMVTIPRSHFASVNMLQLAVSNPKQSPVATYSIEVVPPTPVVTAVTNSASYRYVPDVESQPVALGSLLSIFGTYLGPTKGESVKIKNGKIADQLGDVSVEIGEPWRSIPVLFAHTSQLTVQLPFDLGPVTGDLKLRVTNKGKSSEPFPLTALVRDPGIFTLDSSGSGQAAAYFVAPAGVTAVLNDVPSPAPKGSIFSIYATGCGPFDRAVDPREVVSMDAEKLPWIVAPMKVTIDGIDADILSATAVPGMLPGLVQFNVRMPNGVRSGIRPLKIIVNGMSAQEDVSVVIAP